MRKKKNRALLFLLSLMPGCGHMYLGFMKTGLSLLAGFMASIAITSLTVEWLVVVTVTLYIYSFFHANNLGALNDAEFYAMEDKFLFGLDDIADVKMKLTGKYKTAAAVVLIFIGVSMLWNVVFDLLRSFFGWDNYYLWAIQNYISDYLPRIVIGIAVIWAGIALVRGKKKEILSDQAKNAQDDGR